MGILSILGGAASSAVDTLIGHASSSELQEDTQAHSAQMFEKQKEHEIDMFGRESEYATARAKEQYDRQRALLQDSPGLQMKGLKSAGLNPILAATGGFKSPAGGTLPIPSARASAGAKGGGAGISSGARSNIADNIVKMSQAKLLEEQAGLTSAQKAKVVEETGYVDTKDALLQFAKQIMDMANKALDQARKSGYFGETRQNIDAIIDNIEMLVNPGKGIEITEHTRRQLMKKRNQLKAYKGSTGGRNRRNK